MAVPQTYFEWTHILGQFQEGDDSVITELEQGSFAIDAGTVYRFYNKAQEAYVGRKKHWLDKFNRLFQVHYIRSEKDISVALQYAKGNLRPLAKFIKLKAFPKDLQDTLKKDFEDFVAEIRKNIKESVKKNQPGNERILFIVNTFNFYELTLQIDITQNSLDNPTSGVIQNKRRILF
jgi:hypothetical protein